MDGHVVTHLGFEFNTIKMEVRLPFNKKLRALQVTQALLEANTVSVTSLNETLGFLSHCCQVVPLGRQFLRRSFSLLRRSQESYHGRIHISKAVKHDLRWWVKFLSAWSTVSMIQLSRINHDVATDASGPSRHWRNIQSTTVCTTHSVTSSFQAHQLQGNVCNFTCVHIVAQAMGNGQGSYRMR